MPRRALFILTLLAAGCPARAPDPDPDSDTGSDPDTTETDSDTTSDPCDEPVGETVPVRFEIVDTEAACISDWVVEHLPAEDWYPWWYNATCSEQGCLDEFGYAVDTAGRCLYFNSICSVWEAPMPTGLVGQCWWGDSGLPALDPDHPCCAAVALPGEFPPCPEPE
jgi:hypothetical protein